MIIYKTVNIKSGKFYIGKDEKNNPNYYGSGLLLKRAIDKYGIENFYNRSRTVGSKRIGYLYREII